MADWLSRNPAMAMLQDLPVEQLQRNDQVIGELFRAMKKGADGVDEKSFSRESKRNCESPRDDYTSKISSWYQRQPGETYLSRCARHR